MPSLSACLIQTRRQVWVLALLTLTLARPAAADETLHFGLLPFAPPAVVFKRYGPLRDLLSERLARPVRLETAPDYTTFARRTAQQRYDILWTSPHFALRAADSGAYAVVAGWARPVLALLVVAEDSPITELSQLAGKTIATPPEKALVSLIGKQLLAEQGLRGARAPRYLASSDHMTSRFTLLAGEADAAIMGDQILYDARSKALRLRAIGQAPPVPGATLLVARRLPAELRRRIQSLVVNLPRDAAGRAALAATHFPAYRRVDIGDLAPLRALARSTPQAFEDDPP